MGHLSLLTRSRFLFTIDVAIVVKERAALCALE